MKFEIGSRVLFKRKCIRMHCKNLIEWYALPISKEMIESSFLQCHFWLSAELFKEQPLSKVIGFGEDEPGVPTIRVQTKYKGAVFCHYYDPAHLMLVAR
jgi:hypothetical protein